MSVFTDAEKNCSFQEANQWYSMPLPQMCDLVTLCEMTPLFQPVLAGMSSQKEGGFPVRLDIVGLGYIEDISGMYPGYS